MSNLFISTCSGFKSECKAAIEKKLLFVVLFAGSVILGIILGFAIEPTRFILNYYTKNAENYYAVVMYPSSDASAVFWERIGINLGYFVLFFALGLCPFLIPLNMLILCYRGFVLSVTISVFSVQFGLTGVLIACFLILPQNLLTGAALILASCIPVKREKGEKGFIKKYAIFTLILYLVSLVGAIIEILILCLLLRPMNFYF